jgi:uncharacterized protein YfaS (alpha-2-macroglobulin family)
MKKNLLLTLFWLMTLPSMAGTRDAQWKKVEEAIQKGLPKSAITNLEPIIAGAMRDRAYAEAVKAIGEKIALEGNIQGNKPEEKITRIEEEIAKAPKEMAPVLQTLLGHWYWEYFQQNRWRFMQRTATAEPPGKDFTTWDLARLFAEIDKHFQAALTAENVLKATPIKTWDDLLQKGTMPDAYRPTLYDFIVYEALGFYSAGEQFGAKPEDAFELTTDAISPGLPSPFAEAKEFIAPEPGDQLMSKEQAARSNAMKQSSAGKAYALYRALMRFHANDPAPKLAFASADLERLTWAWNSAVGEDKDARYQAALENFIRAWADDEISALAMERGARLLQQQGDLVAAHTMAERGAKLFPKSPGGKLCQNLIIEIEAKSAAIATEHVWNAPAPKITINYRNVEVTYFKAIPYDWEIFLQKRHHRPQNLSDEERKEILARKPALEWSENLPPTTDYQEKTFSSPAPSDLKPGFYFIVASHNRTFDARENMISMADVWVSELALVTRQRGGDIEGFVLQANSGEPISGAEVSVWHLDNQGNRIADPTLRTDDNGLFSMNGTLNFGYLFRARHNGQAVASIDDIYNYAWQNPEDEKPNAMTVFFTDRAIYRPGQTIQYKGICLWVDRAKDNYRTLKDEEATVVFRDPNGKEIARQKHRANDYGSFAGSFTAPRDRLMGQMALVVEGRAQGTAGFRVEEYKRPKFEVTLDAPKTPPKLKEKATLTGHAMAYTGAAVDGAQVKFRVVRQVRMPWWWGWYSRGWSGGEAQEIMHGIVRTETDGSFKIEFTARPDLKVAETNEPTFEFSINADVTDSAGETRSAERSVRVGYTALEATLAADDWQTEQNPVEITVSTRSLDGEPQAAEGTVKVYALEAPGEVERASLGDVRPYYYRGGRALPVRKSEGSDMSDPNNWPLGRVVSEKGLTSGTNGNAKLSFKLPAGAFRAILETQDRFGKKVTGKLPLQVLNPEAEKLVIKIPHLLKAPTWEKQPGEKFTALWATGYDEGRAFIEIEHRHKFLERYWTKPGQTQQQIEIAVDEAKRGGFTIHITQIRENRAYLDSRQVSVPWRNKELKLKWEHFVSKLQPGQKETWSAVISQGSDGQTNTAIGLVAEMVAALYDESLDAFAPQHWPAGFGVFRQDQSWIQSRFANTSQGFMHVFGQWDSPNQYVEITYRGFPPDLTARLWGYGYFGRRQRFYAGSFGGETRFAKEESLAALEAPAPAAAAFSQNVVGYLADTAGKSVSTAANGSLSPAHGEPGKSSGTSPDLSQITARKNLNETAFFFPQLIADSNGVVRMMFTMPEALTKWRFLGFAHDQTLRGGYLEDHAVTAKDLMVQPNPPRFLREDDTLEFTVKVSNQSDKPQSGSVRLTFNQALDDSPADKLLGNNKPEQEFRIPAKESRSFAWRIHVPDGCGFLTYKAVAASTTVSDGEEGAVPVLSRRILVTESLPLPIRGPGTKKFEFAKLVKSGSSKTLQHQSLTVQMVSHPAWYAVLALPYLMEYPYECSEQTFNRLYANALARNIASSDPKIHRVFEQWRNTPALDSPLEKNQDLKSVTLEETPWVRQAASESQARRNVGILFDDNRLNYETEHTLEKLTQMQLPDGSWPWFPGGRGNDYITLYITTGFGRLRHLGVDINVQPAIRSLQRLDAWMNEHYQDILKNTHPEDYVPNSTDALYLYGRSFFLKDMPVAKENEKAVTFFLNQSRKHWLKTNCRQTQAHLAIALKRFGAAKSATDSTPMDIMKSLKERSVSNEEMGMFWRDTELSWWWYHAPIETQAMMIEAFDEVAQDANAVEECKVWLLKQKQTQDWKTTKATADAVYSLLLRGRDLLSSDALVEVTVGGIELTPGKARNSKSEIRNTPEGAKSPGGSRPEPGTGLYEVRFDKSEIKPKLGEITVKKTDEGVAWGSIHWQYLEDMSKVTPHEGTPLKLKKTLFTKVNSSRGPVLEPVKGALQVGDELVVRIELRTDRDMEYIHMKDQRGSGLEPVNVLSRYRYQDGLGYYESTRDTASHFFMDYLPKGAYVFEYSTRVVHKGEYQTGVAEIQCMYAPEFNSHSESFALKTN